MQVFQVVDFSILELYNIDARSEDSATLGSDMSAIGNLYRMGLFIRPIFAAGKKASWQGKSDKSRGVGLAPQTTFITMLFYEVKQVITQLLMEKFV